MKYLCRYGIPLVLLFLLLAASLFLPRYALQLKIQSVYELQYAARPAQLSSTNTDASTFSELWECLQMQTGVVETYTLKAEDMDSEAAETAVRELLQELGFPDGWKLHTSCAYGYAASARGIWTLEFQDSAANTLRVNLDTQSGVLLSLEYDTALSLSAEQQTALLDLYSKWQIYFPDPPSRTFTDSTIWLSGQGFGLELVQNSEQLRLQLFSSGSY